MEDYPRTIQEFEDRFSNEENDHPVNGSPRVIPLSKHRRTAKIRRVHPVLVDPNNNLFYCYGLQQEPELSRVAALPLHEEAVWIVALGQ